MGLNDCQRTYIGIGDSLRVFLYFCLVIVVVFFFYNSKNDKINLDTVLFVIFYAYWICGLFFTITCFLAFFYFYRTTERLYLNVK